MQRSNSSGDIPLNEVSKPNDVDNPMNADNIGYNTGHNSARGVGMARRRSTQSNMLTFANIDNEKSKQELVNTIKETDKIQDKAVETIDCKYLCGYTLA